MFQTFDQNIISFSQKIFMPVSRMALFIIFFWFGLLKVIGLSPAGEIVENLFSRTIPIMEFGTFYLLFGLFECLIGILFLIKGAERLAITLLIIHMFTTFGPLVFLPGETWQYFLVPTLEGQYIIKNLAILAVAAGIASQLRPKNQSNI